MQANHVKLRELIEGTVRYVVPLFQRPYSWDKKQWETLREDVEDLVNDNDTRQGRDTRQSHFLGSIVTIQEQSAPEETKRYTLIDGQQRLTTIFTLLALLRDTSDEVAEEIHETLLANRFREGDDYFKLTPTESDKSAFEQLIRVRDVNKRTVDEQSKIWQCYEYFSLRLKNAKLSARNLKNAIISRLTVISVLLNSDDNPYLVFESLNAKGMPLTQADLARNYVLMELQPERREEVYRKYWLPMQNDLGDELTEFLRHYLMRDTAFVRQNEVYMTLKRRIVKRQREPEQELAEIAKFAGYYQRFIQPEKEPDELIRRALERLKRLKVTTIYPFLLQCYDDYSSGRLALRALLDVLNTLENYLIRRFVCNVPTNALNKIFPQLYGKVRARGGDFVQSLRDELKGQRYPDDKEFRRELIESPLYGAGDRADRTRLILESLEEFYSPRERVNLSEQSIEHVMPQTLSNEWKEQLGSEADQHDDYVHRLGNLTLTAYNSELSNAPYDRKRQYYRDSNLKLNRYFRDVETWNIQAIQSRGEKLAEDALKVWPCFGGEQPTSTTSDVTGTRPYAVRVQGIETPVRSWRDVLTHVLDSVGTLDPEVLDKLLADGYLRRDDNGIRRPHRLKSGLYVETNRSAESIYKLCKIALAEAGLSEGEEWKIEFQ